MPNYRQTFSYIVSISLLASLLACQNTPTASNSASKRPKKIATYPIRVDKINTRNPAQDKVSNDVVLYGLGLLNIDYKSGGNNPESGLDCSGMISYIYKQAANIDLPHNAAQIANQTQEIDLDAIQAGDLVFFNTMNRPFSHVGLYIGEGRFIHAPRSNSSIQIANLNSPYFASRYHAARSVLGN